MLLEAQSYPFEDNNDSRISLGVVSSKPRMDGTNGGLSVDASNTGYEQDDLEGALGSYYDEVMSLVNTSVQKHEGISPALKTVERAATNLDLLLKIVKDYDEKARSQFVIKVLNQDDVSINVLNYFSNDSDAWIRRAVAENEKTPTETLNKMIESDEDLSFIGSAIAKNPSVSGSSLISLYDKATNDLNISLDRRSGIRKAIATNASSPPDLLYKILNTSKKSIMGYSIQAQLAQNTNLPLDILEELGNGESVLARSYIATNPLTPPELLEKLASDEDQLVRMRVVMSEKIKPETMIRLSEDEETDVRAQVGYNSKDLELLEKLSSDPASFVRMKVALNKATSTSTLEKLKNDRNSDVRNWAEENLSNRQINETKRYSLKFLYN